MKSQIVNPNPIAIGSGIYQDICSYFRARFEAEPERQNIIMSTGVLIDKMKEAFGTRYDPEAIAQLLKNGFEAEFDKYLFKRDDFMPPAPRDTNDLMT